MVTPQQAEELAKIAVADYLTACNIQSPGQIGNVLMKLCSVAGVMMANAEGSSAAAERLIGTANFVASNMPVNPQPLVKLQ